MRLLPYWWTGRCRDRSPVILGSMIDPRIYQALDCAGRTSATYHRS
jgi:hypothetical protein